MDTTRYRHHLRPHTEDEAIHLRESILAEGCRDPLIVAILEGKQYLIDGFNRLAICTEHGKEYATTEIVFSAHEDVLRWIERNARARRNQTRTERAYYLGSRYNREKGPAHRPAEKRRHFDDVNRTVNRIASEEKVSPKSVERYGKFAAHIDSMGRAFDWLKWLILSEKVKYSKRLVDTCIYLGSGGCRDQIEALLTDNPEKSLSAGKILAAISDENDTDDNEDEAPSGPAVETVRAIEETPEGDDDGVFCPGGIPEVQRIRREQDDLLECVEDYVRRNCSAVVLSLLIDLMEVKINGFQAMLRAIEKEGDK